MKKTFKLLAIPTDKQTNLFLKPSGLEFNINPPYYGINNLGWKYLHLYVISTDIPKKEGQIRVTKFDDGIFTVTKEQVESGILNNYTKEDFPLIIASTDLKITPDTWIPQSFIVEYVENYLTNSIEYVELEMEQHPIFKPTLVDGIGLAYNATESYFSIKTNNGQVIINPVQEPLVEHYKGLWEQGCVIITELQKQIEESSKSCSISDMRKAFDDSRLMKPHNTNAYEYRSFDEWYNKNIKQS